MKIVMDGYTWSSEDKAVRRDGRPVRKMSSSVAALGYILRMLGL